MIDVHLARARRDIVRRLRRDLAFVSPLLLIACGFAWFLVFDGWNYGVEGRMHRVQAEVVDIGPLQEDGDVRVQFRFIDRDGTLRDIDHEYDGPPDFGIGDRVAFVSSSDTRAVAQPESASDPFLRRVMAGMFLLVFLAFAGLATFSTRRFLRRRYLLDRGIRVAGQSPHIEASVFSFKNVEQPVWRLHMKRFDPDRAAWVEHRTEWQSGTAPVLTPDAVLPPILVDPRNPSHEWLPAGDLAPDGFWKT